MRIFRPRDSTWQRPFVTVVASALLWIGFLPAVHHHEAGGMAEERCSDSGRMAETHVETVAPAHKEPCGLCAETMSSARPEASRTVLSDELVAEHLSDNRHILPQGPPARHGASRAPPIV